MEKRDIKNYYGGYLDENGAIHCAKCGEIIEVDTERCPNCGYSITSKYYISKYLLNFYEDYTKEKSYSGKIFIIKNLNIVKFNVYDTSSVIEFGLYQYSDLDIHENERNESDFGKLHNQWNRVLKNLIRHGRHIDDGSNYKFSELLDTIENEIIAVDNSIKSERKKSFKYFLWGGILFALSIAIIVISVVLGGVI